MKNFVIIALLGVLSGGVALQAKEATTKLEPVKVLAGISAAELPAQVAKIMAQTPKQARPAVMVSLLRSIAKTHPTALKHVVVAIAKQDATLASLAAATAAKAQPSSVGAIAAATVAAVPGRAGEILAACSSATVIGQATLAQMVASINPNFSEITLARQAADWSAQTSQVLAGNLTTKLADPAAVTKTGGTIYQPLNGSIEDYINNSGAAAPPPGSEIIGYTLLGTPVLGTINPTTGVVTVTAIANEDGTYNTTPPTLVVVEASNPDEGRLPSDYVAPN